MITGGATIFSLLCVNTSNNWLMVKEIEYYHHSRLTGHVYMPFLSGTAPKRSFLTQARRRSTQQSTRGESIQMAQWRLSTQMGGKKPATPPGGSGSKTKMETSSWIPRCRKVVNLSDWNLKHFYYCSYCSNCEKIQDIREGCLENLVLCLYLFSSHVITDTGELWTFCFNDVT